MKKSIYLVFVLSAWLVSCDNYLFDKQLHMDSEISDVRSFSYELVASDYQTIAKNADNIALALAADSDSTTYNALLQVGTQQAFNEVASADMFVPVFVANKFPQLSIGSQCNVSYREYVGKRPYLTPFASAAAYTMDESDYKTIWDARGALYVTPATVGKLFDFVDERFAAIANEGKIILLTYQYCDFEPDSLILDLPFECTLAQFLKGKETYADHQLTGTVGVVKSSIYGRFYLVDGIDSVYVYGLSDETGNTKIWREKGIKQGDRITIKGRYAEDSEGAVQVVNALYISHSPASVAPRRKHTAERTQTTKTVILQYTNGQWQEYSNDQVFVTIPLPADIYAALGSTSVANPETTINTFLKKTYPYAIADDVYVVAYCGTSGMTADVFTFDGSEFVMDDGFVMEEMSFLLKNKWEADISTYFSEPFIGHGQGDFVIQNIALDGLTYVWAYSALYGMKASAYAGNANHPTESWLVSPSIRLRKAIHPALIFEQTQKYAADFSKECTVWVSTDYEGDVTTCSWTQVPWLQNEDGSLNVPDGGSWTFQSSGEMPLDSYVDKTIHIAFKYTSSASASATWEIKNLLVHELSVDGNE